MQSRTQYKHIKVNSEDDDIVIYAGEQAAPKVEDEAEAVERESVSSIDLEAAAQAYSLGRSVESDRKEDSYRGTTLEDIKSSKMPTAQKAVIVVAIVAIAAFIVWYAMANGVA